MQQFTIVPFGVLACFCLIGCSGNTRDGAPASTLLAHAVSPDEVLRKIGELNIDTANYRCQPMVSVINDLRRLGKNRALEILEKYRASFLPTPKSEIHNLSPQIIVICICRALFIPPKEGWWKPWEDFSQAHDESDFPPAIKAKFALFPVVMSDNVPFIVTDYSSNVSGIRLPIPDEAKRHLDRCQALDVIPADLPVSGYDRAALNFLRSDPMLEYFALRAGGVNRSDFALQIVLQAIDCPLAVVNEAAQRTVKAKS